MDNKTVKDLEKLLEDRSICDILRKTYDIFIHWNGGGALLHRVRAAGYLAEAGFRNIEAGNFPPMTKRSTFGEMKKYSNGAYRDTIDFLYPLFEKGILS